jgi:3-dehydroquinate synthase class II
MISSNGVTPEQTVSRRLLPSRTAGHSAGQTEWWFDARGVEERALLDAVELSSCTHVVLHCGQHATFATSKQRVVWLDEAEQLSSLDDEAWVFTRSDEILHAARAAGKRCGLFVEVKDLERDFPRCIQICERGDDFVVVDIEHATYIPYELLLAKCENEAVKLLRNVPIAGLSGIIDTIDQSLNAFATMEHGIGVLFRTRSVGAVQDLSRRSSSRQNREIQLLPARVEEVQSTGLGHRVCVDATAMMTAEEGMIVGSTGWGGILVCSETHYLPHMNLREFRVNAGGIHSYVWCPNDTVLYLSELRAGVEVLCVDIHGKVRVVTVGRAKIERRPLMKIRCSVSLDHVPVAMRDAVLDRHARQARVTPEGELLASEPLDRVYVNTFLQNDWHVRVMGADGKVRHTALVRPGDELLAHVEVPGRHTGLKVTEHILER